jgi:hypothetical protein
MHADFVNVDTIPPSFNIFVKKEQKTMLCNNNSWSHLVALDKVNYSVT